VNRQHLRQGLFERGQEAPEYKVGGQHGDRQHHQECCQDLHLRPDHHRGVPNDQHAWWRILTGTQNANGHPCQTRGNGEGKNGVGGHEKSHDLFRLDPEGREIVSSEEFEPSQLGGYKQQDQSSDQRQGYESQCDPFSEFRVRFDNRSIHGSLSGFP
jgi:hypothetical protein